MSAILFLSGFFVYLVLLHFYQPKSQKEREEISSKRETRFTETSLFESLGFKQEECETFTAFADKFRTYDEVAFAIKKTGMEKSDIIIAVDFTASNEWQGRKTFSGKCLHELVNGKVFNPYQKVIACVGATLENLDSDHLVPAYGFGDSKLKDTGVFPFKSSGAPCHGFMEVLELYNGMVSRVTLGGPTSFVPVIRKAIAIVKEKMSYHILLIITDGQVMNEELTAEAIIEASMYPISIVVVGVGDGPWNNLVNFDDNLPKRKFDNFQFVNFHEVYSKSKYAEAAFALNVLMEIPDQYQAIQSLGYLNKLEQPENNQK
ncbi:E3 ubiquitin-protein ligase RGLG4-like [Anneissia japonica]|uniref:E3 ubiquitin-protein ligase RGLG4-like n=1 Tax=Anneissia japonica TaxID=1529436 RepID=UPI001425A618|nr:E3 ubiquitin-protein ligase RGLG4-like [Anneissia japonica]XP_033112177.1 E3 ubiquitin-protein ligase RGLG4-like [Anneissia japonica]